MCAVKGAVILVIAWASVAYGQAPSTEVPPDAKGPQSTVPIVPTEFALRLQPENAWGFALVSLSGISQTGNNVTGRATMNRTGQDGCRVVNLPFVGTYDGDTLTIRLSIAAGDNVSCPMFYQLKQDRNGRLNGQFQNGPYKGAATQD